MKKLAVCAAVAALYATPFAATAAADIYGELRYSVNSVDADAAAPTTPDGLVGLDNVSLFGLKASTEGDGIKAFVHLQTGANADANANAFTQRFYFGGLTGGFGTVAYGRMTNAYKFAGFAMDPFYNHSHIGVDGAFAAGLGTYGLSPATNGFTDNAVQYTSPDISGLKVNLGLYIDDSSEDDHGTNLGAEYNKGGIQAGVQIASNGKTAATIPGVVADGDAVRLYGGYKADGFSVSLSVETVDDSATTDVQYMFLAAKFKMAEKTELAATLGTVSADTGSPTAGAEGTGITAGIFQTVAPQTQVFFSTSMVSLDATGAAEPSVFTVGAIHKF